jgi:hypothetical protein
VPNKPVLLESNVNLGETLISVARPRLETTLVEQIAK